ncbi:hypothetical protein WR25_11675 [Diploscapter pachys]|uniref:Dilute domain-containing protein n=1 Tax=Diploscapter pachys TaxID=2018661 RepID=A0A2A2LB53_9BILA|nr:hypothetical protein WR25_11675 [Diploscapter pachys]
MEFEAEFSQVPSSSFPLEINSPANALNRPPDYYFVTTFEDEDEADESLSNSHQTSKRVSTTSQEDALRAVHGQLNNLTAENLSLNDKLLRQADELSDARAQLHACSDAEVIRLESLHKQVEHTALLEVVNVPEFARIIISDFKPRLAKLLTKSLPSYLILCSFRFYDQAKDEAQRTSLFSAVHANFKDTVSTSHDIDVVTLWFVNQWKLCNLLRQYAGDDGNPEWIALNTAKQNSHRINNYDMTPIREQLKLRIEECYQKLMKKIIEPNLTPKIVPAILQHESSSDITLATGTAQKNGNGNGPKGLKDLLNFLDSIYNKLQIFGGDSVLIGQVFHQICQWTCSLALNHMMFRKELCNFEKAVQIKHNVSETQSWLYQKGLGEMRETLEPLVQACHLLMSRKDEETICGELTSKLKPRQVVAILQHYDPSDDFEEPIRPDFLIKVQRRLNERAAANGESTETLIEKGTYLTPFDSSPFVYCDFKLETLSLPSCLHLEKVCRLL